MSAITPTSAYQLVPVTSIQESAWNPRRAVAEAGLADLVASIRQKGILTPLLLRPVNGHFEIVAGARRFRAAVQLGLTEVPAIVREADQAIALEDAVVENLQREQIPPLDEARTFDTLLQDAGRTVDAVSVVATRIGKAPSYVWDRLKLLDLVPMAQRLLEAECITVPHAIRLARLTPEQQARVIAPDSGGLFTHQAGLEFQPGRAADVVEDEEDLDERLEDDVDSDERVLDPQDEARLFSGRFKAVSVRELDAWIAKHVRFDVGHAAAAAPLDFGPVAEQVQTATEQPGRGRKVISITHDAWVAPEAKAEGERTYCASSWKRADGQHGSDRCDHALLGVVVVGPEYGQAFEVCVHKDCDVHWGQEKRAREKAKRDAAAGADAGPKVEQPWERENRLAQEKRAKDEQARQVWEAHRPALEAHLAKAIGAAKWRDLALLLLDDTDDKTMNRARTLLPHEKTAEAQLRELVLVRVLADMKSWYAFEQVPRFAKKALGLDLGAVLKQLKTESVKAAQVKPTAATKPGKAVTRKATGKKR